MFGRILQVPPLVYISRAAMRECLCALVLRLLGIGREWGCSVNRLDTLRHARQSQIGIAILGCPDVGRGSIRSDDLLYRADRYDEPLLQQDPAVAPLLDQFQRVRGQDENARGA